MTANKFILGSHTNGQPDCFVTAKNALKFVFNVLFLVSEVVAFVNRLIFNI
jgi:hypothetical protein